MNLPRNHTAPTSRGSSAYPRKRAVTACQVCRARRTKCDQKKPRCSFCEKTNAQCISDPHDSSSFDPASLAILDRLERLEWKLDAVHASSGKDTIDTVSTLPVQVPITGAPRLQLSSCLPSNLEGVLTWPVFQDYNPAAETCSPLSNHSYATTFGCALPFSVGEELSSAACSPWLENFFNEVHVKNPVLDEKNARLLVRRICVDGPGWDGRSCLALLICANGALVRPFSERSVLQHELENSVAMALYSAAQKRFGCLFMSAGIVEAQCALFGGIFLMSILRPVDAWRMFLQGLAICQGFDHHSNSAEEESVYWSCWKSEQELRWELGVSSVGHGEPPRRFPNLPEGYEGQVLRAWYFYLSEISLWRLEMKAKTEINQFVEAYVASSDALARFAEIGNNALDQISSWRQSLAPVVALEDSPQGEDVLKFILRGRITYVNELITWPFLQCVIDGHDQSSLARQWAAKGLLFHLDRLLINSTGFYHRHHCTWLMLRSSARSAFVLLAFASVASTVSLLPSGWRAAVDATVQMLHFWASELDSIRRPADLMQEMILRTMSIEEGSVSTDMAGHRP